MAGKDSMGSCRRGLFHSGAECHGAATGGVIVRAEGLVDQGDALGRVSPWGVGQMSRSEDRRHLHHVCRPTPPTPVCLLYLFVVVAEETVRVRVPRVVAPSPEVVRVVAPVDNGFVTIQFWEVLTWVLPVSVEAYWLWDGLILCVGC